MLLFLVILQIGIQTEEEGLNKVNELPLKIIKLKIILFCFIKSRTSLRRILWFL